MIGNMILLMFVCYKDKFLRM